MQSAAALLGFNIAEQGLLGAAPSMPNVPAGSYQGSCGGWVMVAIVRSFTDNWRKVREAEQTAALKQSMVDNGMSVDEIERVLKAGNPKA